MKRTLMLLCCAAMLGAGGANAQSDHPDAPHRADPASPHAQDASAPDGHEWLAWMDEGVDGEWADAGGPGGAGHAMRGKRGGGRGNRGPGARMHGMAMAQLDLTDAQRARMRDLHEGMQRKAIQGSADLKLARLDLQKLVRNDRPQKSAIDAQIDKIARLRAEQHKARVATMLEARAVLTPEQRKQLRERHERGRGGHGGPGPHERMRPGVGGGEKGIGGGHGGDSGSL